MHNRSSRALGLTASLSALVASLLVQASGCASSDVNETFGPKQWTPLHAAADRGHKKLCQVLIGEGANVDARDTDGNTPLHLAAGKGHEDTVVDLLGGGADPTIRNNKGKSPLDLAAGHNDISKALVRAGG